jgi:hypothetical protein
MNARRRDRRLRLARVVLAVVGLGVTAVAALLLLLASGVVDRVGDLVAGERLIRPAWDRAITDDRPVWTAVGIGAGLLLVVAGLAWLRAQLPRPRRQDPLEADGWGGVPGTTSVSGAALAAALEAELESSPSIRRARAELRGDRAELSLRLDVVDDAPAPPALLSEEVVPALERFRAVTGAPEPTLSVDLRPVERADRVS